ncbi:hypothetical protein C8F04DRAFT_1324720 [Mycena alexandri]|uniref:Mid2 domain-containing protein n=1 Tax=Mycena alexandri TaxID=1745969 RepID=A0AAD6WN70_9AGAR|nr:hypothetical protein C8F04DRAFT_1324720 [Mycena alexandri]
MLVTYSRHFCLVALLSVFLAAQVHSQDQTTCSGTQMDWYTGVVGETPCRTYERLRQICNAEYQVGPLNASLPPDFCTDQRSDCCCNTIAFTLSMLCLNCQQQIGTGSGYDAPVGTLQKYLNASLDGTHSSQSHCYAPISKNFSSNVQTAVCNQNIKVLDDLYPILHSDGSCVNTRDTVHEATVVEANNSFTKCNVRIATPLNNTTNPSTQTGSPPSGNTNTSMRVNVIAIAGIVVGTVGILTALVVSGWILWRRQKSLKAKSLRPPTDLLQPPGMIWTDMSPYMRFQAALAPRKGQNLNVSSSSSTRITAAELSRTEVLPPPAYGQEGWAGGKPPV